MTWSCPSSRVIRAVSALKRNDRVFGIVGEQLDAVLEIHDDEGIVENVRALPVDRFIVMVHVAAAGTAKLIAPIGRYALPG